MWQQVIYNDTPLNIVLLTKEKVYNVAMHFKARLKRKKSKIENWLYDHPFCKNLLHWTGIFLISTVSAFLFACGFSVFLDIVDANGVSDIIVSGGVSGLSQTVVLILRLCGLQIKDSHLAISIIYFIINIPLVIIAWLKIGRQFAIFTIINVIESSIFVKLINVNMIPELQNVINFVSEYGGGLLGRAIFGGIFIGLSSAIVFRMDTSTGGVDIVAYAVSLKRSTSTGIYGFMINATNLIVFTFLTVVQLHFDFTAAYPQICKMLYSLVYLLTCMLVVDTINKRNKKVKLEITTEMETLGNLLLDCVPHGVTVSNGKGVYSGRDKYVFTMVVSYYEVQRVVNIVRKEDPKAFIETTPVNQIYGNFTSRSIK